MRTLSLEWGWTPSSVPTRTLAYRGWIVRSRIDWREKRVSAKMLGPEGGWIVRSHIGWREERTILYKSMETSP